MPTDNNFMNAAIEQALVGRSEGGVPIGSVLVMDDQIVGRGRNRRLQKGSAIRHAEMDALEDAGWFKPSVYWRSTLYTTLSPCYMCAGAVLIYGIPRLVMGENRTAIGAEDLLRSHGVEVVNLDTPQCHQIMSEFIAENPALWHEED